MDSELQAEEEESLKRTLIYKLKRINQQTSEGLQKSPQTHQTAKTMTKTPTNEGGLHRNSPTLSTRHLLKLLELERQEEVQSQLNARVNIFKEFDKVLEERNKQARLTAQKSAIETMNSQAKQIIDANTHYNSQSGTLTEMARLREVALKQMHDRENLLWAANKKLISDEIVKRISENILKYYEEMKKMVTLANSLDESGKKLSTLVPVSNSALEALNSGVQVELVKKCNSEQGSLSEQDLATSETLLSKAVEVCSAYRNQVAEFKLKQSEEKEKLLSKKVEPPLIPEPVIEPQTEQTPTVNLSKYITIQDLERYESVLAFSKKFKQSFAHLENDPALKTFRFDCKKAVNVPVNTLSDVNAQHILDKYHKLHSLLSGQAVPVANKQNFSAATHPQGVAFCIDLLAKKFVLQGDTMVSSNPESAFAYASVMLSLWNDFPDFGQLVLAYFYQLCPYLIPYYVPKQVGESEEEFYRKLGYQYSLEGEVEKQDKFLKRMTGIMRLYFALTISQPKSSQATSPHNLKNSWRWLSAFLKLEPQLDITATALHVFLETVGFKMKAVYGVVFDKIMHVVVKVFLPKCHEASCTGGAVTRLELLVSEYLQKNSFEVPHGYNETSFW